MKRVHASREPRAAAGVDVVVTAAVAVAVAAAMAVEIAVNAGSRIQKAAQEGRLGFRIFGAAERFNVPLRVKMGRAGFEPAKA